MDTLTILCMKYRDTAPLGIGNGYTATLGIRNFYTSKPGLWNFTPMRYNGLLKAGVPALFLCFLDLFVMGNVPPITFW